MDTGMVKIEEKLKFNNSIAEVLLEEALKSNKFNQI